METRPEGMNFWQWRASELNWPSQKFDLIPDILFDELYNDFNTVTVPIQDMIGFHHDVAGACVEANTLAEFHELLRQRKKQRIEELQEAWSDVAVRISANPNVLDDDKDEWNRADRWGSFLHFSREFSFDALIGYFGMFTHPQNCQDPPTPPPFESRKRRATPNPPSPVETLYNGEDISGLFANRTCTTPTQSPKRSLSPATSIGDDGDDERNRRVKRLRAEEEPESEEEVANRTEQRPSSPSVPGEQTSGTCENKTSAAPVQSRKRALSSTESIGDDGDSAPERNRPVKRLRRESREELEPEEVAPRTEQTPICETKAASSTPPPHSDNTRLCRSSRVETRAQAPDSGPAQAPNRRPTPTSRSVGAPPRRSSRIQAQARAQDTGSGPTRASTRSLRNNRSVDSQTRRSSRRQKTRQRTQQGRARPGS